MASRSTNSVSQGMSGNVPVAPMVSPKAPKAKVSRPAVVQYTALEVELNKRLLLQNVLAEYNGPPIRRSLDESLEDSTNHTLRRDFLDKISYLCDITKKGDTVTAAALQELLHCNVLWLAANKGVSTVVENLLRLIIGQLRELDYKPHNLIETTILTAAVDLAKKRLGFYQSRLELFAKQCRVDLSHSNEESGL